MRMDRHGTYVIGEAGVNHNGSLDLAMQLVDVAAEAGVDAVKFQTFQPRSLVTSDAKATPYQSREGYSGQFEMLSSLALDDRAYSELQAQCRCRNIEFLSTPFDLESVELLLELGQETWKIASGEITNAPLIEAIGAHAKHVILSTGMASLGEIEEVLVWLESAGCERDRTTVLHCTSEYPTPMEDVNLRAMLAIKAAFGVQVGYSDHTLGIEIPIAAVALGATVIEKHFTLDRSMPGPDHKASLEGDQLAAMVKAIRNVEAAMGNGQKGIRSSEANNLQHVRKGIYALTRIEQGEALAADNLTTKRPQGTLPASDWHRVLGKRAVRTFEPDEPIEL